MKTLTKKEIAYFNQVVELSNAYVKGIKENKELRDFLEGKALKCIKCDKVAVYIFHGNSYCVSCCKKRIQDERPIKKHPFLSHNTLMTKVLKIKEEMKYGL